MPLRHPDIYQLKPGDGLLLTESQFYDRAQRKQEETPLAYATRLNSIVHNGIASYGNAIDRINGQIPIYKNYLLFFAGYIYPQLYRPYEFCNYQKAIERGLGICSQQSIILTEILRKNNIPAHIVGLSGLVVATAQIDPTQNTWWILEPYYDKIIPYDLTEIEHKPELVRPYYASLPNVNTLVETYAAPGNRIYPTTKSYAGWKKYYIEKLSYLFIWIIPIACL
ncbi:MAG: hypothetical protein QGG64_25345, partial [Candidatus Latescibacteria bacterium]|nr:hypothetical protein [Candidatus Latescibacterota bacterium]